MLKEEIAIFWFRRDLRLTDNAGLYHALKSGLKVLPIFIFDKEILDKLEDKDDARITFINKEIEKLKTQIEKLNSSLLIKYGKPDHVWATIMSEYNVKAVYTNHDYEPYAVERDNNLSANFSKKGINFFTYKDQVIFEKSEIVKDDGNPYVVFTPYKRKWLAKLSSFYIKPYPTKKYFKNFIDIKPFDIPSLELMGFEKSNQHFPDQEFKDVLNDYGVDRDFPAKDATSRISVHLRFGTVSIRDLVKVAQEKNSDVWLSELIWRDFYFSILFHFPYSATASFRKEYDQINWRNNEEEFKAWCEGKTGYPIVDAGMRQLNESGFMHNRIRMVVASFLTKHLLIDWRWGERYFARKLLDYELSSNVGGWQWAAGSGVDAAPYFRIFNPYEQVKKFDKDYKYIKKWVPEYADPFSYPKPIVDHKLARERCLETYKKALK
ncbi:deoxyribodipyrimidine photolyase [Pedobacter psychrophilus]|uniref:Deoxyribodipyrimidine photolyase n=1 Tax=Pedobacter psychrophilus TaxID=1826909 RepID=A0A179DC83_9SPHI|nr:deoxyribodipyrimidine photo-lyase [Pedobacter psychrophilus]OAQ38656.1 deoxyribodipyrimidine photolyase [Pedobacter psychrophilus]